MGRPKIGKIVKWDPQPGEGPYRPFFVQRSGRYGQGPPTVVAMVESNTTEELKVEIQRTRKTLSW